jgi:hypothetical protein
VCRTTKRLIWKRIKKQTLTKQYVPTKITPPSAKRCEERMTRLVLEAMFSLSPWTFGKL